MRLALLLACTALHSLAAQDTLRTPAGRLSALPVIGSAPETGLQYGATAIPVFRTGPVETTRPSQLQLYAINTTEGQQRVFLQLDRWSEANAKRTRLRAEFQHFPLPYFAPETGESEARYTATGPELTGLQLWRTQKNHYRGVGLRLRDVRVSDVDLKDWTHREPPEIVGSTSATVQYIDVLDSRDAILGPTRGYVLQSTVSASRSRDHAPGHRVRDFGRVSLDARGYRPAAGGVIAGHVTAEGLLGIAPFDMMPSVGSDTLMRGYVRGRHRDQLLGTAEVEFRSGYWHRLGFATFAGAGVTASTRRSSGVTLGSLGGGIRYQLQPADRLTIRVDYARSRHGGGLYVALGEAF